MFGKNLRKEYDDWKWRFIKDYEVADERFSEFLSRLHEHESGYGSENCGLSPEQIRKIEKGFDDEYRLSAQTAWEVIHENLVGEHDDLLYGRYGLRARSEAAWREHLVIRMRSTLPRLAQRIWKFASRPEA